MGTLRIVALSVAIVGVIGAGGAVAAYEVATHRPPAKLTVAQVAAKVRPAVVTVRATVFRGGVSEGQGFLFGRSGHVLTSARVVAHATQVSVVDAQGVMGSAAVVGVDKSLDIAELLTSDRKTAPLEAAGAVPAVGTSIVVVGNVYSALPYSVLSGAVAGTGGQVTLKSATLGDLLTTDVAVQPGNSGGPIVDSSGRLVGMVVASDSGRAFALPVSRFAAEVKLWAREDNIVRLGPPLVEKKAPDLLLVGVPLEGFAQTKSETWSNYGIHVVYIRPPTYDYGGAAIDIYLDVEPAAADARSQFGVSGSIDRGFTRVASSTALGDQAEFLERHLSNQVAYEVAWRDRNVNVYMYLGSGLPPAPDISLATLISLAVQQEAPIGADLADW